MIRRLIEWWHASQREIDLTILWPQCCMHAPDLHHAKVAFAFHCYHDKAWLALGDERIDEIIDKLDHPL